MIMNWISRIRADHTDHETAILNSFPAQGASTDEVPPSAPLIDSDETLVGEFGRARRYEQTLTIVVVSPVRLDERKDARPDSSAEAGPRRPDVLPLLAAAGLREALRESDVLCYRPALGRFILGLPQTDAEAAKQAMRRVGALFRKRLRIELVAGVAEFPVHGVTLEDLVETAGASAAPLVGGQESVDAEEARARRDEASRGRANERARTRPSLTSSPASLAHEARSE